MTTLSPLVRGDLNFTALIARESGRSIEEPHGRPFEVSAWECSVCGDLHKDEEDAFDCCAPVGASAEDDADAVLCPVCRSSCPDHRNAADCCLWHDLDAPTRWRISDAVEAGDATWAEAIEAAAPSTPSEKNP
jgi:rubredoxin